MTALETLQERLSNKDWRIRNLYLILNEDGETIPFAPRDEQEQLLLQRHNRNFIPKARKLGVSTFIVLENLDECLFRADTSAGIVDLTEKDAHDKLEIARFAWERGPFHPDPGIAEIWKNLHAKGNPLTSDASGKLVWENGSAFTAGVSYTGKTPQRLHISEYGPIAAQNPGKATRIKRGSMNAVPKDGILDIETTMEGGRFGECYSVFRLALESSGGNLSQLDWRLHFFPWHNHPSYDLPGRKPHRKETFDYFTKIEREHGLKIPASRQAWYELKKQEQQENMYQQFPTIIEECDRHIVPGQIYPEMIRARAEGRVTRFNPEKGYPLFTSWDLGSSDNMAGWLIQPAGKDHNFLAWAAGEGTGAGGVASVMRQWEERFGPIAGHLVPHDVEITDKGAGKTYLAQLVECGIPREKIIVVPRIPDFWVGVDEVRRVLPNAWFHSECDEEVITETGAKLPSGVGRLEGYRKKLDTSTGFTREIPVKDICDHTADAARTYAEGLARDLVVANVVRPTGLKTVVMSGYKGYQS